MIRNDNPHPKVPVTMTLIQYESAFRGKRIALTPSETPTGFVAYRPTAITDTQIIKVPDPIVQQTDSFSSPPQKKKQQDNIKPFKRF